MATQEKIADKLGISQGQLSRFLSGESRGKNSARKIADLTGINWLECFEIDGEDLRQKLDDSVMGEK